MQIADENYVKAYGESVLREKADRDYISARILYYYQLYENYIYFISQACEKYLKSILLLNVIKVKDIGHDLVKLKKRIEESVSRLPNILNVEQLVYFNKLNEMCMNRYDEVPSSLFEDEIKIYDGIIWSIRKYCRFIIFDKTEIDKNDNYVGNISIEEIIKFDNSKPMEYSIPNGFLEKIINVESFKNTKKYLVSNNDYYGNAEEKKDIFDPLIMNWNQPFHFRSNECLKVLSEYIKMPVAKKSKNNIQR